MKKVLVTLVLVMTLGVSVSFAQAAPVEDVYKRQPLQFSRFHYQFVFVHYIPIIKSRIQGKLP